MFTDFIHQLDTTDQSASTTVRALWDAWVAGASAAELRVARRRDLEAELRKRFPVGLFNHKMTVAGVSLPGAPRRPAWTVTSSGKLKSAFARARGLAEAAGAAT